MGRSVEEGRGGEVGGGGPFEPDFSLLTVCHSPDLNIEFRIGGEIYGILQMSKVRRKLLDIRRFGRDSP